MHYNIVRYISCTGRVVTRRIFITVVVYKRTNKVVIVKKNPSCSNYSLNDETFSSKHNIFDELRFAKSKKDRFSYKITINLRPITGLHEKLTDKLSVVIFAYFVCINSLHKTNTNCTFCGSYDDLTNLSRSRWGYRGIIHLHDWFCFLTADII